MKLITIEIFKTTVPNKKTSLAIVERLNTLFPESRINFDLEDCDKILRVEGSDFTKNKIITVLTELGYKCELLE